MISTPDPRQNLKDGTKIRLNPERGTLVRFCGIVGLIRPATLKNYD